MSDKIDLWELPYEGKTVYVLLAARSKVSALADSEIAESLATSDEIQTRVAQCPIPRGLMDRVPAACLIHEGQVVSRVKDVEHSLVLRENAASGWEEDGVSHFFAGKTVDVFEPDSRSARVRLGDGLKRIDFLPVANESARKRRVDLATHPHRAGAWELSKKFALAALSFVLLLFGPAIRERIEPVIEPVAKRVPDLHSRGEFYGMVFEFFQIDHVIDFVASLFSPIGVVVVPAAGLVVAYVAGWKGARDTGTWWEAAGRSLGNESEIPAFER
ncbi:hypothetical protein MHJ96_09715 [Corynebacterium aurimucosum]|nr:hypothetical protein [Corynebacterium aurimucosum]